MWSSRPTRQKNSSLITFVALNGESWAERSESSRLGLKPEKILLTDSRSHRVYKDSSHTFVGLKMTKICWISVFWSHCCMNGVIPSVPSSIKQLCRFSDRKSVRPLLPPAADEQLTVSWLSADWRSRSGSSCCCSAAVWPRQGPIYSSHIQLTLIVYFGCISCTVQCKAA